MDKDKVFSRRWITLFVVGVAAMIVGMQTTMINTGLDTLRTELGVEGSINDWLLNSYLLAFAALVLLMGVLGDKYGRKLLFNIGLIVFGAGALWAVVASNGDEFVASQALMGAGAAMLTPQTLSIIVDVFKKTKERALAISVWTGLVALGVGLGPLVAGLILDDYELDYLFLVSIPVVLLALIIGFFVIPESKKTKAPSIDLIGLLLSALAVLSMLTAFIWVPEYNWISMRVLGGFVAALVFGVLFVKYEDAAKHPLIDLKHVKTREFIDGKIGVGVVFFNLMGVLFIATQFLQVVQQKSALDTGLLILPMAVTVAIASLLGYQLATKFGNSRTIMFGIATTAVGVLLISFWSVDAADWIVATTLSVMGLGAGMAMAPATNSIMKPFGEKDSGVGSAINVLVRQVAGVIGITVLGSVLSARYSDNLQAYVTGAPEDIANQITGSIEGAFGFSSELMIQGQVAIANSVVATTSAAFMTGVAAAMAAAAIVTIVVSVSINRSVTKN